MRKVVIIGAGELGSRHLQGIAQSSIKIDVEVVEPFKSSRKVSEDRYHEIERNQNVNSIQFFDSIEKLSNKLDLVIVATGSNVRFKVVTELLAKKSVANLVLEKVLFQTIEEYYTIEKLLNCANTKCWVNHTRRMFPVYKELKERLKEAKQVSYNYHGGNWGLACNGLHFIDQLSYLVDSSNLSLSAEYLDKKIYASKRKGFIEFNGLLTGKLDNHSFSLYSNENFSPSIHSVVSDVLIAKIDEDKGEIFIAQKNSNWVWETLNSKIVYFQSELSNKIVEDIIVKRESELPRFKDAMNLHIPFIESLLKHMDQVNGLKNIICPIT
jgi:predicted dehydrogenase